MHRYQNLIAPLHQTYGKGLLAAVGKAGSAVRDTPLQPGERIVIRCEGVHASVGWRYFRRGSRSGEAQARPPLPWQIGTRRALDLANERH